MKFELNVYDEKDNIVKKVQAKALSTRFGTVRRIAEIMQFESLESVSDYSKKIFGAWSALTKTLGMLFPEMTDEDWDGVKNEELIPLLQKIADFSVKKALLIPGESGEDPN
ncbi:MAG: hypothetical protein ACI4JB_04870 [Porcipelethomonas sp.]